MKNVTVSEVLCYLEEISKYRFVYDSDAIDRMQRVDVEMKGTKLETVLESIFVKSGFSFVIEFITIFCSMSVEQGFYN